MEHAYSMLDMKVVQFVVRGVSMTYRRTVGNDVASVWDIILPEAILRDKTRKEKRGKYKPNKEIWVRMVNN